MKFFSLLTYCTATFASIAPLTTNLTTNLSNTDVKVRDAGEVTETAYQPSLTKLLSRDSDWDSDSVSNSERAYKEARRAAGRILLPGTYYYFMNCNDAPEDGHCLATTKKGRWMMDTYHCSHVGLVVGKTSWIGRKFKARYIHVKLYNKGLDQSIYDYTPFDEQRLIWGGKTTKSKANINRLLDAGEFDYPASLTSTDIHHR